MSKQGIPAWLGVLLRWMETVFNLRGMRALYRLPRYFRDWAAFSRTSRMPARFADSYPCLADATTKTPFDSHYFFQAAWLARKLSQHRAGRHVDIGSDVNAIGVISAFVDTMFIDYRPLDVFLKGLENRQGDLLHLEFQEGTIDSLSCLHVIEHVGLGRYGDPIDPDGAVKAAAELSRVLAPRGSLFLSVPVGRERACFNAHRVFDPASVTGMFVNLRLQDCAFVDDAGRYLENVAPETMAGCDYGCGMFHFVKGG
jgi:SAM-dependent methyltransferase